MPTSPILPPQEQTFTISINEAQLSHIIAALRELTEGGFIETKYDVTDVFYIPPQDTLEMMVDMLYHPDPETKVYGLCL